MPKKTKIRNSLNYIPSDSGKTKPQGESMTVPGESYSISELMQRSSGHIIDSVVRDGIYDDDVTYDSIDMEKIREADLYEKQEAINDQIAKDILKAEQDRKAIADKENTVQKKAKSEEEIKEPEGTEEPEKPSSPKDKKEQDFERSPTK